jgi:hypothetical protein
MGVTDIIYDEARENEEEIHPEVAEGESYGDRLREFSDESLHRLCGVMQENSESREAPADL